MKLKLIRRKRLMRTRRDVPTAPVAPIRPSDGTMERKRENLYRAIRDTQAFLHKRTPPDSVMESIRRYYPAPLFFIESNRRALEKVGLGRLDAFYYSMITDLTRTSLSQQWGEHPRLNTLSLMSEYLRTLYIGVHVECFYLIMMDRRGRLIRARLLQRGGVDNAPFYLGQLLTAALGEDARFLVLAHNHPGGTRRPSREDLLCTLRAINAFASLGIPLLDHLIVARDRIVSIRQTGMVSEQLWMAASPGSKIIGGWLDVDLL